MFWKMVFVVHNATTASPQHLRFPDIIVRFINLFIFLTYLHLPFDVLVIQRQHSAERRADGEARRLWHNAPRSNERSEDFNVDKRHRWYDGLHGAGVPDQWASFRQDRCVQLRRRMIRSLQLIGQISHYHNHEC